MVDEVRAVLATTAARWLMLVETVPEDLLERAPAAGEWSAADCLRHLLRGERDAFSTRLVEFLEGVEEWMPRPPPDPAAEATPTAADAAAQLDRLRRQSLARLAGVGEADLERTMRHPSDGLVSLGHLLSAWSAHDLQHTMQAEEALMQIFLPGSGRWRPIFAAHDVESGPAG